MTGSIIYGIILWLFKIYKMRIMMKKRYLLQAVLIGCMIFAGCGTSEKEVVASVEEIPIEINTEVVESA